jgi:16S rRNA (cytosine967-C5)-methyltransferase
LAAVRRTFAEGAYTDRALRAESDRAQLDARDRAQATRLAFGTVQRRGTLDHLIEALAERPTARLDPPLLDVLRLGLYELLWSDGAPDRAVVSDAVELAKGSARAGHGLVNAVLRRGAREGAALLAALGDETPAQAAIAHSHPRWVVQAWWELLGAEHARALLAADNAPAEAALRANPLVLGPGAADALLGELPVAAHTVQGWPDAVVLDERFDAHGAALFSKGAYMPQSRASQLIAPLLDPAPGERILDLCAAPGAKTTHLAALAPDAAELLAVERHPGRAVALEATCRRMAAERARVLVADAAAPGVTGLFERVLVDPPCSGLGTLQARPDLRWRVREQDVADLAVVQRRILRAAADCVGVGGTLLYSTCTLSPPENEDQIERFLATRDDFECIDLSGAHPELAHPGVPRFLLTLPHRDGTAGFFIASLRRTG